MCPLIPSVYSRGIGCDMAPLTDVDVLTQTWVTEPQARKRLFNTSAPRLRGAARPAGCWGTVRVLASTHADVVPSGHCRAKGMRHFGYLTRRLGLHVGDSRRKMLGGLSIYRVAQGSVLTGLRRDDESECYPPRTTCKAMRGVGPSLGFSYAMNLDHA